ncbi:MAG: L,D-transpeptidase family protein [Gammaproteobacteria bacterium]
MIEESMIQRRSFWLILGLLIAGFAFIGCGPQRSALVKPHPTPMPTLATLPKPRALADVIAVLDAPVRQRLQAELARTALHLPFAEMALLAFKQERRLEVWARQDGGWRWFKTYPFTAFSGALGPKLREGDGQIPEGVYGVAYLNPNSQYHLSIKVAYPNAFDRAMGAVDGRERLGGDIFIHGKDKTIGCIPIGDRGIEELFYLVDATGIDNVRIVIAPYDMRQGARGFLAGGVPWSGRLYRDIALALRDFQRV